MLSTNGTEENAPGYGTAEHAHTITDGRHPGVRDALQWLTYAHLPEQLRGFSRPFYVLACTLIGRIATDAPELTTALNKLIEAKDSAMRAGIRHDTGRAGSVPRPQEIVDPPILPGPACLNCGSPQGTPHGQFCPAPASRQPDAVRPRPIKDNPQG